MTKRKKTFQKGVRRIVPIRLFQMGKSKGGKSKSAIQVGQHLAEMRHKAGLGNGRLAAIETELVGDGAAAVSRLEMYHGQACECEQCRGRGMIVDFDILKLGEGERHPDDYMDALREAAGAGYGVVVIDSIYHGWKATLEWVDQLKKGKSGGDPWGKATPVYRAWVEMMLNFPGDLIVCSRVKTKYDRNVPKGQSFVNLGDVPDFRDGIEYEFDHVFYLNEATATCVGSRASEFQNASYSKPGLRMAADLSDWSTGGVQPQNPPSDVGGRAVQKPEERPAAESARPPAPKPKPKDCKHRAGWSPAEGKDGTPGTSCDDCGTFRADELPADNALTDPAVGDELMEQNGGDGRPDPGPFDEPKPEPKASTIIDLVEEITQLGEDAGMQADTTKFLAKAGGDKAKLAKLRDWLRDKIPAST